MKKLLSVVSFAAIFCGCRHGNDDGQLLASGTISTRSANLVEINRPEDGEWKEPQLPNCAEIPEQIFKDYKKYLSKVETDFKYGFLRYIDIDQSIPPPLSMIHIERLCRK